ncbi:hypothetical protein IST455A_00993 [Burkholderia multivorans]|uniref:hypothetical protein n=1 Tax=Burkholderia multivorans TaxID=87883 RepID=UPI00123B65A8|nr:hypothetical protein [Burkholderia multivorans]MBU9247677.1 hypothetical protein [Burkholderia multivorans]QET31700.1 hypothetical protein FOB31_18795 [Burkholderia multivorans]QET40880.1 hypothetical protein FOB30_25065 [Burkholderia multivorans]CAB5280182.1 hypothetical protein IST495A_03489 [Burkholderia multivorans]CAB5300536.1 hypothetical protein IST419_01120 [Burkholderia multivorans]
MNKTNPQYEPFDRNPPAGLDSDDAKMSDVMRYMRVTAKLFEAFGWQMHPVTHSGYLRWSAPAKGNDGYVLCRTYADTSGDCAHGVTLRVGDLDDCDDAQVDTVWNDLSLLVRLAEVHRTRGIGRVDVDKLIEAVRDLVLVASGHEPGSMPIEVFAAHALRWETERAA